MAKTIRPTSADILPAFGNGSAPAAFKKSAENQDMMLLNPSRIQSSFGQLRGPIYARNNAQKEVFPRLLNSELSLLLGPAGTAKTFLAMAAAVPSLLQGKINKIVVVRPAVEAGEKIGFLPGDANEKLGPYMVPVMDTFGKLFKAAESVKKLSREDVENRDTVIEYNEFISIVPVGYMRGRTFDNTFIVVDEAQNLTEAQVEMVIGRIGENSRMVLAGDRGQCDLQLKHSEEDGVSYALKLLEDMRKTAQSDNEINLANSIFWHEFSDADIVRHRLVQQMMKSIEKIRPRRVFEKAAPCELLKEIPAAIAATPSPNAN